MSKSASEIRLIQTHRLEAFILRARRICEHSLLSDLQAAKMYGEITWKMRLAGNGALLSLSASVPPEEALESLAARVRPLLLQNEEVSLYKVLKTVRFFADEQQDAEASEHLDAVKSRFDGIASGNAGQYSIQVYDEATGVEVACTNLELAEAWLYGDVVHADTAKHSAAMSFGIGERYAAAVGVYMNTALVTNALLTVVQQLQKRDPSICSVSSIMSPVVADIKDGQLYSMAFSNPKAD